MRRIGTVRQCAPGERMEAVDAVAQNVAPQTGTWRAHCEGQIVATVRGFLSMEDGRTWSDLCRTKFESCDQKKTMGATG